MSLSDPSFLELVQLLHEKVGAGGVAPTAVTSQTGEAARLVNWIRDADLFIQNLWHNWKFLRATFVDVTVALNPVGLATGPNPPADLSRWDYDTFMIETDIGSTLYDPLLAEEYQRVRTEHFDTTLGTEMIPARVIIMPDGSLRFDPVPDDGYAIKADYYTKPTPLAANDAAVSVIPAEFRRTVLIGRAMIYYGNYENAGEIKDEGVELYSQLDQLESLQLPNEREAHFISSGSRIEVIAE